MGSPSVEIFRSWKILSVAVWTLLTWIFLLGYLNQSGSLYRLLKNHSQNSVAVVTFLATPFNGHSDDKDDDDVYYIGARLIAYQLLHAPQTRFLRPTPFIVLVTPDVRESKRQRLIDDGAIVKEVARIEHNIRIGEPRWVDTFTKLRIFDPKVVSYDKVLYMDTDLVITRPLDAIFFDPNTKPMKPLNNTGQILDGETLLPDQFVFAATPETVEEHHPYPYFDRTHTKKTFNSGFMLYSPSQKLFDYCLEVMDDIHRYFHGFPDQDLLNYVYRWDGPMPWKRLHFSWNINWSNDDDFDGGMAALHVKWWDTDYFSRKVRDYALAQRWEMEGYWRGHDGW